MSRLLNHVPVTGGFPDQKDVFMGGRRFRTCKARI